MYVADRGHMYSTGKVIDRGNFYEVQDVTILGTHDAGFEPYKTTLYIRKNAKVRYQIGKSAEDVYNARGGKIVPEDYIEYYIKDGYGKSITFDSDLQYESLDSSGYIVLLTYPSE